MPIYEYRCAACGHHLEALQKMAEGPLRKCPDCGKSQLKRLVSASRFRLKGSGWYETDFKNKGETQRNLVEKAGGESTEAASEKSTDKSTEKSTDASAKAEAGKAVAAEKSDGAAEQPAKPKPASTKPRRGREPNRRPSRAQKPRAADALAAASRAGVRLDRAHARACALLRLRRNIPPSSRLMPPLHSKG